VVLDDLGRLGGSVDDLDLDAGLAAALGADGPGCRLAVLSLADGTVVADPPVLRTR